MHIQLLLCLSTCILSSPSTSFQHPSTSKGQTCQLVWIIPRAGNSRSCTQLCVEYACSMRKVQGSTPSGCLMTFYDLFFSHEFWHFPEFWTDFYLVVEGLKSEIRKLFIISLFLTLALQSFDKNQSKMQKIVKNGEKITNHKKSLSIHRELNPGPSNRVGAQWLGHC